MDTSDQQEHRRYNRIPFHRAIRFQTEGFKLLTAQLAQDISEGGIRMNSDEFIPLGSLVKLLVKFEDQGRQLDLDGKVVWIKYVPRIDSYQLGLEFLESSSFERNLIARFVGNKAGREVLP